eukprot:CAMPEP_0197536198 /NCGR_PEP_ID=MMETSP1318-20131121/53249_1 /TAXON_ID=552666 /ORGANISM="Partenskyella glossopodia, Strain RCC365" /LENGTH=458 /DNA_ID=CAMNT_0043094023 /DNA_START=109 /DNA_END=1482 /DNA_ORIENTATION=+
MSRFGEGPPPATENPPQGGGMEDMIAAAKQKAMEIANKLSAGLNPGQGEAVSGPADKQGGPVGAASQFPVSSGAGHGEKVTKKIFIPVDDYPDINFLGLLIGPGGRTIKSMQQQSGARFIIQGKGSSRDGQDEAPDEPLHVFITADTNDQLNRGSQLIEELLFDHDKLYAKKREQLASLGNGANDMPSSLYDAKVTADFDFSRGPGGGGPGGAGLGYNKSKDIRIANDKVGLVIGRGGETIKNLQADTGARIQIAKEVNPGSPNRVVTLSGSDEQIERAEREVTNLIERRSRPREGEPGAANRTDLVHKTVQIPQDKVGLLIGKGGETIRYLQSTTNCRIQVTRDSEADRNAPSRKVSLSGTDRQVAHAESEIESLMAGNRPTGDSRPSGGGGGGGSHRGGPPQGGPSGPSGPGGYGAPPGGSYGYGAPPPQPYGYGYPPPTYGQPPQGYGYGGYPPQ